MLSISASDYRKACREVVQSALKRPQMYFESLRELEAIMQGHATAFSQLASIVREETFHSQFSDWLFKLKGLSCAGGWAYAIEEQCKESGDDPVKVFGEYAGRFLDEWNDDHPPENVIGLFKTSH
ncbi:MAG: hypothetical protein WKF77_28540 [Planctomycetaceae bacterium]